MQTTNHNSQIGTITLLGLGPGDPDLITREGWHWLDGIDQLYVRSKSNAMEEWLPKHIELIDFYQLDLHSEMYDSLEEVIIDKLLREAEMGMDVTFAVPGDPFIGDSLTVQISNRAKELGVPLKIIHGLSYLAPTFQALDFVPDDDFVVADSHKLTARRTPTFSPASPALITRIVSKKIAEDLVSTLLTVYPEDHPVTLIHDVNTVEKRIEKIQLKNLLLKSDFGPLTSLYLPPLSPHASFESFQEVIARLRAPDGCPWDREQTHTSLRPFLLEEAYETLDALDRENMVELKEELGDLLLQIVLHAQIANENGDFNIQQVLEGINTKLIRRHPHVFSEIEVADVSGVIQNWEAIKAEERRENDSSDKKGILDGVPKALPALLQAQEIVERVRRMGMDPWNEKIQPGYLCKMMEMVGNAEEDRKGEILGEVLLSLASLAHHNKIEPESALRQTLNRFRQELSELEDEVLKTGCSLAELSDKEKARIWQLMDSGEKDDPLR